MKYRYNIKLPSKFIVVFIFTMVLFVGCRSYTKEVGRSSTENMLSEEPKDETPVNIETASLQQIAFQRTLTENGEEYTFYFDYKENNSQIVLTLTDNKGIDIQQLDITTPYLKARTEMLEKALLYDDNFIDLNFDGYLDYRCKYGELGRSYSYAGWVWNPEVGLYQATNLSDVGNMRVEERTQTLRGGFSGVGGAYESIYRLQNGVFVEVNRLEIGYELFIRNSETGEIITNYWEEDGAIFGFREYCLFNGEMVEVWPDMICNTTEGREQIYEHLFGKDSIWFPTE